MKCELCGREDDHPHDGITTHRILGRSVTRFRGQFVLVPPIEMFNFYSRRREPKFVEPQFIKWFGNADDANHFIGDQYGTDWEFRAIQNGSIWVKVSEDGTREVVNVGDLILRNGPGFEVYKPA